MTSVEITEILKEAPSAFAVIEDPEYEFLIASTIRHMARADYQQTYQILTSSMDNVRKTMELRRILTGLESELGLRASTW